MRNFLGSCAAGLLAACVAMSKPPPVEVQSTGTAGEAQATRSQKFRATVLGKDAAGRNLTLKLDDGRAETIKVSPELRRFDEIALGDTVEVDLREGLLLEYQPAGSAVVAPAVAVVGAKTGADQVPGGVTAVAVQTIVTVTAIDLKGRIVELEDPEGNKRDVRAGTKLAIEKLKIGDRLVATYVATMAIALEKKP
ncbi:MAG: hypothetical protein ACJ79O_23875 [Myxococcales bacterium]